MEERLGEHGESTGPICASEQAQFMHCGPQAEAYAAMGRGSDGKDDQVVWLYWSNEGPVSPVDCWLRTASYLQNRARSNFGLLPIIHTCCLVVDLERQSDLSLCAHPVNDFALASPHGPGAPQ